MSPFGLWCCRASMPRCRLLSRMLLVPQAIQTPQLSTGLPALVDPANECIRSATELKDLLERCAVQRADCGMRTAKDSRGLRWSKGEEKGRAKPPAWLWGRGTGTGTGTGTGAHRSPIQALQWACRDWPGGVWGRQPVWHRSAPALVAAIDKRKKVQPGNRRYCYLASSAATAPCKPETTGLSSSLRLWLCFAQ